MARKSAVDGAALAVLIKKARAAYAALPPQDRAAHDDARRQSWVRGEKGMADWEAARGIAPDATGDASSEAFIRQQRDEWEAR